jgi:hypothetical protein
MRQTINKNNLPGWFKGELYEEGGSVQNRFSGEEIELTPTELSMYDFIMGATMMMEMGISNPSAVKDLRKGLDWFRETNPEAYKILLD